MEASKRMRSRTWVLLGALSLFSVGCVAGGPLIGPPEVADATGAAASESGDGVVHSGGADNGGADDASRSPIRLVSFPSIEIMPLWPSGDEAADAGASIAGPLVAGKEALQAASGQVRHGMASLGQGTRRAFDTTTNWLTRPWVGIRAQPGEPSLLGRIFSPAPSYEPPRTTLEFLSQDRVR